MFAVGQCPFGDSDFRCNSPNFSLHSGVIPVCGVVLSPQVSGVSDDQLLVSLYPGLPTTAELFILPDEHISNEHKRRSEEALETVRNMISKTILGHLSYESLPRIAVLLLT